MKFKLGTKIVMTLVLASIPITLGMHNSAFGLIIGGVIIMALPAVWLWKTY